MSSHLISKEIDNLVSGLASVKDVKKAQEHLDSCQRCRMIVDALSCIVAPKPSSSVPGDHIRKAVIAEWHRLHNASVEKERAGKPRIKKFFTGFAFAASVIIAVSAYIFLSVPEVRTDYPLSITSVTGEVYFNNYPADANTLIESGSVIKTAQNSYATVSSDNYNLYIGRSSVLEVTGNNITTGMQFRLSRGQVISKSSGSLNYSFECGSYKITPAGTEFLLNFSGDKLNIAVSEGKIIVTGPGMHIEIAEGHKWSSANTGKIELLDEKTASLIISGTSGLWPVDDSPPDKIIKKSKPGNEQPGKTYNNTDIGSEEKNISDEKKEKQEKIKLKREIRDEINEMKKEHRKGRKGRNKD